MMASTSERGENSPRLSPPSEAREEAIAETYDGPPLSRQKVVPQTIIYSASVYSGGSSEGASIPLLSRDSPRSAGYHEAPDVSDRSPRHPRVGSGSGSVLNGTPPTSPLASSESSPHKPEKVTVAQRRLGKALRIDIPYHIAPMVRPYGKGAAAKAFVEDVEREKSAHGYYNSHLTPYKHHEKNAEEREKEKEVRHEFFIDSMQHSGDLRCHDYLHLYTVHPELMEKYETGRCDCIDRSPHVAEPDDTKDINVRSLTSQYSAEKDRLSSKARGRSSRDWPRSPEKFVDVNLTDGAPWPGNRSNESVASTADLFLDLDINNELPGHSVAGLNRVYFHNRGNPPEPGRWTRFKNAVMGALDCLLDFVVFFWHWVFW